MDLHNEGKFPPLSVPHESPEAYLGRPEVISDELFNNQQAALCAELRQVLCGRNNELREDALRGPYAELVNHFADEIPYMPFQWTDESGARYAATHKSLDAVRTASQKDVYAIIGMAPDGGMVAYVEELRHNPSLGQIMGKGCGVERTVGFTEDPNLPPNVDIELNFSGKANLAGVVPRGSNLKTLQVSRFQRAGSASDRNIDNPLWQSRYGKLHTYLESGSSSSQEKIETIL